MNPDLQYKFEKQMVDAKITSDRRIFNKDSKGIYTHQEVRWMYFVWINQEAKIEKLKDKHAKQLEESYMCGYTEAEYDFMKRNKEK